MPAIEVKTGKYLIIKQDAQGNFYIPVNKKTPQPGITEFEIPLNRNNAGEAEEYKPKAIGFDGDKTLVLPLIELPNGNGHVPTQKKGA